jgi:nitric oxide reductase NorE protein
MTLKLEATPIASSEASESHRHLPGVEGVWVFVYADMAVFALIFGSFMWDRHHAQELFETSRQALSLNFGGINTLILLTSSMLVVLGVDALKVGRTHLAPGFLFSAMACGVAFIVSKILEYGHKFDAGIGLTTNAFFQYYFIMTGLHLGHVVVGTAILAVLAAKARAERPGCRVTMYEGGATYWHMVDLLWVCIFPLLYLVR